MAAVSVRSRVFTSGILWNATSTTSLDVRPLLTWPARKTARGLKTTLTLYHTTPSPLGSLSPRRVGSIATRAKECRPQTRYQDSFRREAARRTPPRGVSVMKTDGAYAVYLCNGATLPDGVDPSECTVLDYRSSGDELPLVRLGLPDFVRSVFNLPDRCDLLEIAAYVFAADRLTFRGSRRAVEYQAWSRKFVVKVRDYEFWCQFKALRAVLLFATGDHDYGSSNPVMKHRVYLTKRTLEEHRRDLSVMLFSGGIDSRQEPCNALSKPINLSAAAGPR